MMRACGGSVSGGSATNHSVSNSVDSLGQHRGENIGRFWSSGLASAKFNLVHLCLLWSLSPAEHPREDALDGLLHNFGYERRNLGYDRGDDLLHDNLLVEDAVSVWVIGVVASVWLYLTDVSLVTEWGAVAACLPLKGWIIASLQTTSAKERRSNTVSGMIFLIYMRNGMAWYIPILIICS